MPMGPRVPARIDVVQSSSRLSICVESHRDAVGDGEAFDRLEQHDDAALKRLEEGLEVLGAQARARGLLLVAHRRESRPPLLDELLDSRLVSEVLSEATHRGLRLVHPALCPPAEHRGALRRRHVGTEELAQLGVR